LNDFIHWFTIGLEHIADIEAYDHILFLLVLCGIYSFKEWKSLLVLITAFTIGHSLTLALSVLNIFTVESALIELLIPLTILSTCIINFANHNNISNTKFSYALALFFGLIHGMGFSYLLKSLLGKEENILYPLFAFNIGIEAGQIIIVVAVLFISLILSSLFNIKKEKKNFFISSAVFGIAFIMAIERLQIFINQP
jgi:ABC-type antimicrobial peptide transport system permease subunit